VFLPYIMSLTEREVEVKLALVLCLLVSGRLVGRGALAEGEMVNGLK